MRKLITLTALLASFYVSAGTFNSTGASTSWSATTSWTLVAGADADGIPDLDDDAIILSGHSIVLASNTTVKSLTINAGGTFSGGGNVLGLKANFTNNGTVSSGIKFSFVSATTTITSVTALVASSFISSTSTVTLAAGTQLTCNVGSSTAFALQGASVFNNNGTLIVGSVYNNTSIASPQPTFNNLSGAILTMSLNLPATITLNSSNPSTINLLAGVTSVPVWTYHHLVLQGSGSTKTAAATLNINGNLTINNGVTLNLAANTLNLAGNLTNSGTISNISTVLLKGTATQTLTSAQTLTIPTLNCTNSTTIVLNTSVYNLSSAVTFPGNLTLNAGATLNLNNNTLNLAGNLSNSGTISNIATVLLNGTATQTLTSAQTLNITTLNVTNTTTIVLNTSVYNLSSAVTFPSNLTINAGATLNLNSNTLNLAKNLTNSGTISNPAIVNFNGNTAQTISFTNNLAFTDITSSNAAGVSITSGTHTISNSLTVTAGNLNVGALKITLLSDAAKTAYIGNSAGTISGSLIVQRYVSARATNYHDFSSCVTSTTIDDWDDELYMSIGAPNNVPGYPGGDGSSGGGYSVWKLTPTTQTWVKVLTGSVLTVGRGYDVYVGDDPVSFPGRAIDTRGTPNMGTPTYTGTANFWNLIGNPHASYIELADLLTANPTMNPTIYMMDNSGNYTAYTNTVEIPAGQGFQAYFTSATVSFPQAAKRTTTSSTFYRTSGQKIHDLKLRLSSGQNPYFHEIEVVYDKKSKAGYEDRKDLPFFKSNLEAAPSITFTDGDTRFTRNYISTEDETTVLPLTISTPIEGNYLIDLEGLFSSEGYNSAYLINNLTKESHEINDGQSVTLFFEANTSTTDFSLVLTRRDKSTGAVLQSEEGVSIFATSENIVVKSGLNESTQVRIELYNTVGQLVSASSQSLAVRGNLMIPSTELTPDVYIVKVISSNGNVYTKKVVVSH